MWLLLICVLYVVCGILIYYKKEYVKKFKYIMKHDFIDIVTFMAVAPIAYLIIGIGKIFTAITFKD